MSKRSSKVGRRRSKSAAAATVTDALAEPLIAEVEAVLASQDSDTRRKGIERAVELLRTEGADDARLSRALAPLAEDPRFDVRYALAEALGHVTHRRLDDVVWRLCRDDNARVKRAAIAAQRRRGRARSDDHGPEQLEATLARIDRLGERFSPRVAAEARSLGRAYLASLLIAARHDVPQALAACKKTLADGDARLAPRHPPDEWRKFRDPFEWRLASISAIFDALCTLGSARAQLEATSVRELVEEALRDVIDVSRARAQAAKVTTKVTIGAALVIDAPRERLRRGLQNVIQNAFEALEARGQGHIAIEAERTGQHVAIRVRDDGPGIPRDEQGDVFRPGHSSKKGRKGSVNMGYGLVIAQAAADDCGGVVNLESEEGKGTTVTFLLPVQREEEEA
jgi:signal transduction histidine kinase